MPPVVKIKNARSVKNRKMVIVSSSVFVFYCSWLSILDSRFIIMPTAVALHWRPILLLIFLLSRCLAISRRDFLSLLNLSMSLMAACSFSQGASRPLVMHMPYGGRRVRDFSLVMPYALIAWRMEAFDHAEPVNSTISLTERSKSR